MQKEVAAMLQGRILVGHALHNDLKVRDMVPGPLLKSATATQLSLCWGSRGQLDVSPSRHTAAPWCWQLPWGSVSMAHLSRQPLVFVEEVQVQAAPRLGQAQGFPSARQGAVSWQGWSHSVLWQMLGAASEGAWDVGAWAAQKGHRVPASTILNSRECLQGVSRPQPPLCSARWTPV